MAEYCKTDSYSTTYYKDAEMTIQHRADGPAYISHDGCEEWWFEGKLHREDGPAIIAPKSYSDRVPYEEWHRHGLLHREDGPAVVSGYGEKYSEWYINGVRTAPLN